MRNLTIFDHPLIQHNLTYLREKRTTHFTFRRLAKELAGFMLYEVIKDYPLEEIKIETPLMSTKSKILTRDISLILIIRAGLGMLEGLLEIVPTARVGHIGLYRNEKTLEPVEYYVKIPDNLEKTDVILIDPMLATGGSAKVAVDLAKNAGAQEPKFICIIAAPEGVSKLNQFHPDVRIYTAALDDRLDEHGYILPGMGDAGDRLFGTK